MKIDIKQKLIDYYKDKGLLIVGLNDSQGLNTTSILWRKGLLERIKEELTTKEFTPDIINAFSLTMNKTEHIEYFLRNNPTIEEIKLSQVEGITSALQKLIQDKNGPQILGNIGYLSKVSYLVKESDKKKRLTTSLQEAKEPTIIYSSGANNLMREIGANPMSIKKDYQNRHQTPNYDYTLEKTKDPKTLDKVLHGIERNFDLILNINNKTDIYALGNYTPTQLQEPEFTIFKEKLIYEYNERLKKLCNQYNITFINTNLIVTRYLKGTSNFHISSEGQNVLANYLINEMFFRKTLPLNQIEKEAPEARYHITELGSSGIMANIYQQYLDTCDMLNTTTGYEHTRVEEITQEHLREYKVFQKVEQKRK